MHRTSVAGLIATAAALASASAHACAPGLVGQGFVCNDGQGGYENLDPGDFRGDQGDPGPAGPTFDAANRFGDIEETQRAQRAGIAMSNAIAAQQFDTGHRGLQAALSGGYFDGQSAGALGIGGAIDDRLFLSGHAARARNDWSGGVSVTITSR